MADKNSLKKPKRLSKGERTHVRRLKQAARKEVGTNSPQPSPAPPARTLPKAKPILDD